MGKSQQSFNKKEREKKRKKKREEKLKRKEERKDNPSSGGLDDMIAYVDEFGNLTDSPPDPKQKKKKVNAKDIEISIPKLEKSDDDGIYQGKVAFFNESKGYGFINDLNSSHQYFVHKNGLLEEIQENDSVSFELEKGLKGMNAINVKKNNTK